MTTRAGPPPPRARVSPRLELAGHALAVEDVHLAAPGFDADTLARRRRPAAASSSLADPSGQRSRPPRALGQVRQLLLGLGERAPGVFELRAGAVPGGLDDAVPVLAVVPGVEIGLELLLRPRRARRPGSSPSSTASRGPCARSPSTRPRRRFPRRRRRPPVPCSAEPAASVAGLATAPAGRPPPSRGGTGTVETLPLSGFFTSELVVDRHAALLGSRRGSCAARTTSGETLAAAR